MSIGHTKPIDTTTEIETPEHIRFQHHVAGPARRGLAYLIDMLVRGAILLALGILLAIGGVAVGDELGTASVGVLLFIAFVMEWFYFVFFEVVWGGRTPGKRALSLRVIGDGGQPLTAGQSFIRNLLRAADLLPTAGSLPTYLIGALVMGKDEKCRRLGDLAAGTMVIVEKRVMVDAPLNIYPLPSPQELANLPQRLPVDGDDLEGIELLLRREYKLSPARMYELASLVAGIYAERLKVRVHDPVRFLKVIYARARGMTAVVNQQPPPQMHGWGPQGGWAPQGFGGAQGFGGSPQGYGAPQGFGGPPQGQYGPPQGHYGPPPQGGFSPSPQGQYGPPGFGPPRGPS